MVTLKTNFGDITLELFEDKAPKTVANFLSYVEDGFFDNTIFHRVINNFMIQGGGFTPDMEQKDTKDPIENEADNGVANEVGTIAMARTQDPHSACAFGKVTEGVDVVEKIKAVKTGNNGYHQDVPVEPVIIEKAVVA